MDKDIIPPLGKKQKRTPNTECFICGKPLYRRPFEFKRSRYFACMEHRGVVQKVVGLTNAQLEALKLGRPKGTNHLEGIPKSEKSKRKRAETMKRWCADNPDKVKARGQKVRGDKHYNWNGGSSNLNQAIRQMTENRKWMDAVKERDDQCVRCGSVDDLEAHHIIPLADLINQLGITSRIDAQKHTNTLWNINNGETLCRKCHYKEHDRAYEN